MGHLCRSSCQAVDLYIIMSLHVTEEGESNRDGSLNHMFSHLLPFDIMKMISLRDKIFIMSKLTYQN